MRKNKRGITNFLIEIQSIFKSMKIYIVLILNALYFGIYNYFIKNIKILFFDILFLFISSDRVFKVSFQSTILNSPKDEP